MIKGNCSNCGNEDYLSDEDKLCWKCIRKTKILVVDIEFNNDLLLEKCVIFNDEPKHGESAIQDDDLIKNKFQKLPWYSRWDGWIYFQNKYINGHCHVENIKSYNIRWINKYDTKD